MTISVRTHDLDDIADLTMFAAVVEHGGLSEASRKLSIPKSRLSRRLSALEERYGVQLIHRSTRQFVVTDLGMSLYKECQALLEQAHSARSLMGNAQIGPHGLLRVSAPPALTNFWLAPLLSKFLASFPTVQLELTANDAADLLAERIDIALYVRPLAQQDPNLVVRQFGECRQLLVAAPSVLAGGEPAIPEDLNSFPLLGFRSPDGVNDWVLTNPMGQVRTVSIPARLATFELNLLQDAAINGLGIAMLPEHLCQDAVERGALRQILPDWNGPSNSIHAAYLSRRGLSGAGRAFLDFLVNEAPSAQG